MNDKTRISRLEQTIEMLIAQTALESDKDKKAQAEKLISRYARIYKAVTGEFYRRTYG